MRPALTLRVGEPSKTKNRALSVSGMTSEGAENPSLSLDWRQPGVIWPREPRSQIKTASVLFGQGGF